MGDIYHVYIDAPGLRPDSPELTTKLDKAQDWIRYADNCWLVHTTSSAARWYDRLGDVVRARGGNVFIIKVDPSDRQGWMPKSVWNWIRESRGR